MKLLFDQNISPRILKRIESIFPDAQQVRFVGLENESDSKIFEYARVHNFSIVTFDVDFIDLVTMKGAPPKVIWLRIGNMTTRSIAQILEKNLVLIQNFLNNDSDEILEVSE